MQGTRFSRQGRKGIGLVWAMVVMVALCAIASFAVDYGRVQLAKTELLRAADAAARAAVASIAKGVTAAQTAAISTASFNKCDGTPVTLIASDIELGIFDTSNGTFTPLSGPAAANANAARVTARRTAARGNPIQLTWAKVVGRNTCDVHSLAIATITPPYPGYVGLDLSRMFNVTNFDSYNSANGPYVKSQAGSKGVLIGQNDLWLHDNCTVHGEAHWGPQGALTKDPGATVNPGPLSQRPWNLTYPSVDFSGAKASNNNSLITKYLSGTNFSMKDNSGTITYPGGVYYFTSFNVGKGNTILFSGPTTIYLDGSGTIEGNVSHISYRPYLLTLKVKGGVHVMAGCTYAYIYAPDGGVHHHNTGQTFGSVIAKLLCFRHNAQGHYDESGGPGGNIMSVK
jgi:Flp pilus assembly protein TadG